MRLIIDDGWAVLGIRISPAAMIVANKLEGRKTWLKAGGLSFLASGHNIEAIKEAFPNVEIERRNKSFADEFAPVGKRGEYVMKTIPFEWQKPAIERMYGSRVFALFMEQGTGKTKPTIDWCGKLWCDGEITGVIVFSKNGVHSQWAFSQFPIHCGCDYIAEAWPKVTNAGLLPGDKLKVLCMNWDCLRSERALNIAIAFCKAHKGRVAIIADESQEIKNANTTRWDNSYAVRSLCKYAVILTGTPVAKDLTDEWAQLKWLDRDILGEEYETTFRNEYCLMGGFDGKVVVGVRNMERFRARVDPISYRVKKTDIGFAKPLYEPWAFRMTEEQRDLIYDLKKTMIAILKSGEEMSVPNRAVMALRMQQISNGFIVDDDGKIIRNIFQKPTDNPRVQALLEKIESTEGKIIIWARFVADIETIQSVLGPKNCAMYYGKTKDDEMKESISSFLSEGGKRFFVSNPAKGGTGLNLQGLCTNDIYYSNSDNSIERWQAEARIDRIGTVGPVTHTDLLAYGSMDFKIRGRHRKKEAIAAMAVDDLIAMLEEEDDISQMVTISDDAFAGDFQ